MKIEKLMWLKTKQKTLKTIFQIMNKKSDDLQKTCVMINQRLIENVEFSRFVEKWSDLDIKQVSIL